MNRPLLISANARTRRARPFFGARGVVRNLRRPEARGVDLTCRQPYDDTQRALQAERARFAAGVDLELRLACRSEAAMRRELGRAARAFVRSRANRRLGFVRLSDYARERLGVSARTLQSAAWLATRLEALPAVSTAYDRSELSWAAARAICKVAVAADEHEWLAIARRSTVEQLECLVARRRRPDGVPADPDGEPDEVDGEPAVRWRFACPSRVRALWRRALALASRAAGEPLADWRAAEIVAAEGASGRPHGASIGDRVSREVSWLARRAYRWAGGAHPESSATVDERARIHAAHQATIAALCAAPSITDVAATALERRGSGPRADAWTSGMMPSAASPPEATLVTSDPFALDARLAEAARALRTIEPRIGRLLRIVADHRLYRALGHSSFDHYVRERLGLAARKAWALLKLEKATLRSPDFDRAYRDGRLSWVRALSLLPVLERTTAPAWIARADSVTVRRLCDEVEWVLTCRDALGPDAPLAPPPVDSPLPSPIPVTSPASRIVRAPEGFDACRDLSPGARLQIRAHETGAVGLVAAKRQNALELADVEIRFTGPATVVALLRDVLEAFAEPDEPRWMGLERLLRHVITHWESTPRHPDPVFARDGWRCTVPACSSRRNLHDHHIRFRSRGGDNRRDNRTTVCAAHHLHGLHDGTIRASGVAPHAIAWELGVRSGAPPLLQFVGDRRGPAVTPPPAPGSAAPGAGSGPRGSRYRRAALRA